MVIKTFNVDPGVYAAFSSFCKEHGFSMSKQITWFMQSQVAESKEIREAYVAKLAQLAKGSFIAVDDFEQCYL